MSVDSGDIAQNVEQDLIRRKAARFRQPSTHIPLPEFASRYAPSQHRKPMKDSPRVRAIVCAGPLLVLERAGWPAVKLSDLGGEYVHNSRFAAITVSGEQEWRQLYSVLPLEEVKRQAQLFAAAPDLLGSSSKAPKRTGRKAASDEDERFLDALRGAV